MSEPEKRIEAELARLGEDLVPPVGWETRVLANAASPAPRRRWWLFAAPLVAVAAALALLFAWPKQTPPQPMTLSLQVTVDHGGGPIMRGSAAQIGDVLHAVVSGGKYPAVWIYRGDHELLAACPSADTANCRAVGQGVEGSVVLTAIGDYSVVALMSNDPIPAPTGNFDADVAAAKRAGARVRIEQQRVR